MFDVNQGLKQLDWLDLFKTDLKNWTIFFRNLRYVHVSSRKQQWIANKRDRFMKRKIICRPGLFSWLRCFEPPSKTHQKRDMNVAKPWFNKQEKSHLLKRKTRTPQALIKGSQWLIRGYLLNTFEVFWGVLGVFKGNLWTSLEIGRGYMTTNHSVVIFRAMVHHGGPKISCFRHLPIWDVKPLPVTVAIKGCFGDSVPKKKSFVTTKQYSWEIGSCS